MDRNQDSHGANLLRNDLTCNRELPRLPLHCTTKGKCNLAGLYIQYSVPYRVQPCT